MDDRPPRRRAEHLTWPQVAAVGVLAALALGVGTLVLICVGRWPG